MISPRPLPDRPLAVSELSLGCAQLGNMYREVSDADARDTVDAAWELGVRYFDTAPHYGLASRSKGSALRSLHVTVTTTCFRRRWGGYSSLSMS